VAKAVRNTVLATPGFTLAEADWKAIEAVLVGYFADDPDYIRAAKLGIHDILGSHILAQKGIWPEPISLSWDDDKIKAYVKKFKKDYDKTLRPIAKIVAHSSGYGTGEFALSKLLRVSVKEAKFYLEIYNSLAPKVRAWQAATRLRAQKEGFLVNPYGYMRNFFDILRPIIKDGQVLKDKNGAVMVGPTGEEANEVLAFLPQSTAAGILRECILEFDLHQNEDFFPLVPIHDSILFEIKSSKLEEYIGLIQKTMTAPVPQLGGLVIDVELKVGPTWGKMKDI
jgi:DNA polymerase I-like protein with 3'-5' exonuclease and polymerase domains